MDEISSALQISIELFGKEIWLCNRGLLDSLCQVQLHIYRHYMYLGFKNYFKTMEIGVNSRDAVN